MNSDSPIELITGELKEIENQMVTFYEMIGNLTGLNVKATKIFAYLQIYDYLTQDQLKDLCGYSLSTISTTLQLLIQANIVTKNLILGKRLGVYRLKRERVTFVYTAFDQIVKELEELDPLIATIQDKARNYSAQYPEETEFFIRRLNSLRNYTEAQRRAINGEKKYSFFNEKTNHFLANKNNMRFPNEIKLLEDEVSLAFEQIERIIENDSIGNKILFYLMTRGKLSQQTLVELTNYSLSTISRYLNRMQRSKWITTSERGYRKPQYYILESLSLGLINSILDADRYIFSWTPKFQELLNSLKTNPKYKDDSNKSKQLIKRIQEILEQIEYFREGSVLLEQALEDLKNYLSENK